jgi:hypothetical protein
MLFQNTFFWWIFHDAQLEVNKYLINRVFPTGKQHSKNSYSTNTVSLKSKDRVQELENT